MNLNTISLPTKARPAKGHEVAVVVITMDALTLHMRKVFNAVSTRAAIVSGQSALFSCFDPP